MRSSTSRIISVCILSPCACNFSVHQDSSDCCVSSADSFIMSCTFRSFDSSRCDTSRLKSANWRCICDSCSCSSSTSVCVLEDGITISRWLCLSSAPCSSNNPPTSLLSCANWACMRLSRSSSTADACSSSCFATSTPRSSSCFARPASRSSSCCNSSASRRCAASATACSAPEWSKSTCSIRASFPASCWSSSCCASRT
mmetsp:Transcript_113457/g.196678  ORF Transcript_113457/g.196678 Transcript_113457/m.196678 type:complete len:200 (+) Transcript_113457:2556-3155(+)